MEGGSNLLSGRGTACLNCRSVFICQLESGTVLTLFQSRCHQADGVWDVSATPVPVLHCACVPGPGTGSWKSLKVVPFEGIWDHST